MSRLRARGLPADWLNAWLAAIGATVLVPELRLTWTDEAVPVAEFTHELEDVGTAIVERFPTAEWLSNLVIAREHPHCDYEFARKVDLDAYWERAKLARGTRDLSVACTVSDLARECGANHQPAHGPFDPPAPGPAGGLHQRLMKCRRDLPSETEELRERMSVTLNGMAVRTKNNGLGFDYRRIEAGVQANSAKYVDTCVEVLAFFGLWLFPVRGDGYLIQQRGWANHELRRGAFTWPVWTYELDRWAIDSVLDIWYGSPAQRGTWGLGRGYRSVPYIPKGEEKTRGYGSEPLR